MSRVEPELGIAQARLNNIELGSMIGLLTNEPNFKTQSQLTKSSRHKLTQFRYKLNILAISTQVILNIIYILCIFLLNF